MLVPNTSFAQSGGNCSVFRTWVVGDSLTSGDLNSSFTTVGVTNVTQACIDGISDSVANMQGTASPWSSTTESLATSGAGELQRLRYVISDFLGLQYWYRLDRNIDFASTHSAGAIQGSGLGRHVTAVGLHTWSGFRQGAPRPAQYPAITSIADHWTGIAWPAVGHMSLVFGDNNVGGGVKGGVESYRVHATAVTLHHAAALRFAHSTSQMHGGQRGHVTALQIHRGLPGQGGTSDDGSENEAAYKDSIVLGHAAVGLMIHGTGITGGANRLFGLSNDGRYLETKTISGTLPITHQAGQIVFGGLSAAATQAEMEAASLTTVAVTPGRTQYHPGVAKTWGQWNDAGTIAVSYNIASISDTGVGNHTVNVGTDFSVGDWVGTFIGATTNQVYYFNTKAAGTVQIRIDLATTGAVADAGTWYFVGFGDQ